MPRPAKIVTLMPLIIAAVLFLNSVSGNGAESHILELTINGPIGPATDDYIKRTLETASVTDTRLVVIRLDTPGGLDTAMRGIVKNISSSSVPVATYVAPTGARAASAGAYILYASHIAAMAPGTNVGAATPVRIGGGTPPDEKEKDNGEKPEDHAAMNAVKSKAVNDAAAYIRSLADLHGRNREWAEKAVREAASLSATEALKLNVIDIIAADTADLLKKINGREINVQGGKTILNVSGLPIREHDPDWRNRLLSVITDPNIAYILMLIGIYGLILEFYNPGAVVPGTVGAISLLLALYALQMLPVNYAGMGLIILGAALMVGEAFAPGFGILGIGGIAAFVIGSVVLIDTDLPGFGIDISVIATFAVISVLVFIFLVGMAIRARRRPVVSGAEQMIGGEAVVINDFDGKGKVSIHSETWNAFTNTRLHKGQHVKVIGMKGLTLQVEPQKHSKKEA